MQIVWTEGALASLVAIRQYIAEENPYAAAMVAQRIMASTRHLAIFPESGRHGLVPGTREVVVTGLPYTLVYAILGEPLRVEIWAVWHDAQDRET